MPCGPKTYGRQRGRPKKREGKKAMNDKDYEMIGESIWDTYRNMASIIAETEQREPTKAELAATGKGKGPAFGHKRGDEAKPKPKPKETPEQRAARIAKGLSDAAQHGDA